MAEFPDEELAEETPETQEESITRIVEQLLKGFKRHYHRTYGMHNIVLGNPLWHPYYWTDMQGSISAQVATVARVYIEPIYFPAAMTISQMACYISVAGGVGTFLRLGLYADNGGSPLGGALLFDSGNINANVTGPINAALGPLARPKGVSTWAAIITDSVATLQFMRCAINVELLEIGVEMMNGCRYDRGGGFGAFTDPCPAVANDPSSKFWGFVRVDSVQPL